MNGVFCAGKWIAHKVRRRERTHFTDFCAALTRASELKHNRSDRVFEVHSELFSMTE